MKRDMDIIRAILLQIDQHEQATMPTITLVEFSPEQVAYHVNLLAEGGYITGFASQSRPYGVPEWIDIRLTWDGHEFIEAAKNDTVWAKFKDIVTEKGGTITFSLALSLLTALSKDLLGLP